MRVPLIGAASYTFRGLNAAELTLRLGNAGGPLRLPSTFVRSIVHCRTFPAQRTFKHEACMRPMHAQTLQPDYLVHFIDLLVRISMGLLCAASKGSIACSSLSGGRDCWSDEVDVNNWSETRSQ